MGEPLTPDNEAVLAGLKQLPIGAALGESHLARLARISTAKDYPTGAVLFEAGEPAQTLWIVVSGRVSLSLEAPGRERTELAAISRGEMFGWAALEAGLSHTVTARVSKPARCLVCSGPSLRELCELDHELGFHLMRLAFAVTMRALGDSRMQLLDIYGHPC